MLMKDILVGNHHHIALDVEEVEEENIETSDEEYFGAHSIHSVGRFFQACYSHTFI